MSEPVVRVHVGDTVVARVAAQRARRVPGVVALRADLAQALLGFADSLLNAGGGALPTDGVHASVRGGSAEVSITLATRLGHNCRDVAQAVQQEVAAEVRAYTGLDVVVRVTVAEVLLG
ncbi:Asp23/Gls24 family envelope stress response protein [Pseudonocardia sp.]|uniref:Asp23/Gls24 family envelope stress response protein n=1 Tax=Pseudonocardia sp. TaxID=60912 RepID=UPI002619A7FC|nr:Asp23/Gls24 family envelope stress response protein [Pseudonocardia sp.]